MSRFSVRYPYFTNNKGQYYVPCWDVVAIGNIQGLNEADAQFIKSLPFIIVKSSYWAKAQGYRVLSLLPAKNFLDVNVLSVTEAELDAHLKNTQLLDTLKNVYKATNNPVAKKLQTLKTDLEKGKLQLNVFDAVSEFGEGDCVALFCATKDQEGFVQKNGDLGPLSKALIFNNERDAESSIKRSVSFSRYTQFQTIKVEMRVANMGRIIEHSGQSESLLGTSVINSVQSAVQKKALQQALEKVSRDEIEEELQKRNKDVPSQAPRRM